MPGCSSAGPVSTVTAVITTTNTQTSPRRRPDLPPAAATAPAVSAWPSWGGAPLQSALRLIFAQVEGYATWIIFSMKKAANMCANTRQGTHMAGIAPPRSGFCVAMVVVAVLLMLLVWCCRGVPSVLLLLLLLLLCA